MGERRVSSRRSQSWIIWFILVAVVAPVGMTVTIGELKFAPGRIPLTLLLLPAIYTLFQGVAGGRRHLLATDFFMILASMWMVLAAYVGSTIIPGGSNVLDLSGAYILARAYIFGIPNLKTFIRALKFVVIVVVGCAFAETLSGRYLISNILDPSQTGIRLGLIRASSTFVHPILYGTFCTITTVVFAYSENTRARKAFYAGLSLFGAVLSLSSAPLMGLGLFILCYLYDSVMYRYNRRWQVLWTIIFAGIGAVFVFSNAPIAWLISHLIFDAENGYYRLGSWYDGLDEVARSPLFGFGFQPLNDYYLAYTIDTVWLVIALRYGIPAVIFILLANVLTFWRIGRRKTKNDAYLIRLRTGFTAVLVLLIVVGLTVDYYDAMWIFWGLCVGIRASIEEEYLEPGDLLAPKVRN
jgi:hypothetical protein